jgi:hypothetical protein
MSTKRPIVFISGRGYEPPLDGWARRLHMIGAFVEKRWRDHPRYLLSSTPPPGKRGWQWIPTPATSQFRFGVINFSYRYIQAQLWHRFNLGGGEFLSLVGGTELHYTRRVRQTLARLADAYVIVGRCEFLGLVKYRAPGQCWILDSTDSVYNLEKTYRHADRWRRYAGSSPEAWLERIRALELGFAKHYDVIVNLSAADQQYYAEAGGVKSVLEDTCVTTSRSQDAAPKRYDVGYLGGTHDGALKAANNLITLARMPAMADLNFAIAGRVGTKLSSRDCPGNLTLVGSVPDAQQFLRQCRVVVMFAGTETGVSVKFQEALASGATVIANRLAARFSLAEPGKTHLEAETIDEICALLREGTAFKFKPMDFGHHFTEEAFARRFEELIP